MKRVKSRRRLGADRKPTGKRAKTPADASRYTEDGYQAALAIQLALDPNVLSVRHVLSLTLFERVVAIQMLVADTTEGRVAFDIVDARPERDLDEDGLLLLTLQHHDIRLVEIDCAALDAQPRASNCRRIWRHRNRHVEASLAAAVDLAVAEGAAPTVRTLGRIVGMRFPLPTICALICQKRLQTDLGKRRLDLRSTVRCPDRKFFATIPADPEVCDSKLEASSEFGAIK